MDDILKTIPKDHPAHAWVEFMISSPDVFQPEASGRWMAVVDWTPGEGYLVSLDPDDGLVDEGAIDGLWADGRAAREGYRVLGGELLLRAYAAGEEMFGQDWRPNDLRLVDKALQKVILGSIQHE